MDQRMPVALKREPCSSNDQDSFEIFPASHIVSFLPQHKSIASIFTMHITIASESMATLRHAVTESFGGMVAFMRIQSIDHAKKMKISLCLTAPIVSGVMEAIMHALPCAEFGRITRS
jgi:hypothetical protein